MIVIAWTKNRTPDKVKKIPPRPEEGSNTVNLSKILIVEDE
jgi:hypothetical protein